MPTALLDAIKQGDASAVAELLASDPHAARIPAEDGATPVQVAIYHGEHALVPLLLPHVVLTAVEAAMLGDLPRLTALLDADGTAVATRSGDGWTPLHAGFMGHPAVIRELLARGADVHARSGNYMANTPLHAALAGRGSREVVELLLAAGADPNATSAGGYTPLHIAASRGSRELIALLLAHGADPAARTDDGKLAADIAEERGHPQAAEMLRGRAG